MYISIFYSAILGLSLGGCSKGGIVKVPAEASAEQPSDADPSVIDEILSQEYDPEDQLSDDFGGAIDDILDSNDGTDNFTDKALSEASIVINNDEESTASLEVQLSFSASNATDMYVTDTPGCEDGGVWEPYTSEKDWVLSEVNSLATVFAIFRDGSNNLSECVEDSIFHDNTLPPAVVLVDDGAYVSSQTAEISWQEPMDTSDIDFYEVSVGSIEGVDDVVAWVKADQTTAHTFSQLPLEDSTTYFGNVRAVDKSGNTGEAKSGDGFTTLVFAHFTGNGDGHGCARFNDGSIKCFGANGSGQLGYGDMNNIGDQANEMGVNLPFVSLGTGLSTANVVTGDSHTCALITDGTLKCWGLNSSGQLGYGDTQNRGDNANEMGDNLGLIDVGVGRTVKSVHEGRDYNCAILDNNLVKCWGDNSFGNLGLGDINNRGDTLGEMGSILPYVSLGTNRTAKTLQGGIFHMCAILDNDTTKCWGRNDYGQLGQGDILDRGDTAGEMGNNLNSINLGTNFTPIQLAVGRRFTCALSDVNTIKCFGRNSRGQLGLGDVEHRGDNFGELGDNLALVNLGSNLTAKKISSGDYHTCAILNNDLIKCWGDNEFGQLGYEDIVIRGDAVNEMGDNLPYVNLGANRTAVDIWATRKGTCAHLDDGALKCWGENLSGQLGQGSVANIGDSANEMGDQLDPINLLNP